MSMDQPDPDNPGVSIAFVLGALVDVTERNAIALERIGDALDDLVALIGLVGNSRGVLQ